jgi:hypothetical protein
MLLAELREERAGAVVDDRRRRGVRQMRARRDRAQIDRGERQRRRNAAEAKEARARQGAITTRAPALAP